MYIKVVEPHGFCYGVRRAIKLAKEAIANGERVCSVGPIIHNPQVVERLKEEGLGVVKDLSNIKNSKVMISSHGIYPELLEEARRKCLKTIDATCPNVQKSQRLCRRLRKEGHKIIIVGDREHPEVKSLLGFTENEAVVVGSVKEIERLGELVGKIGVVAQTTQSMVNFAEVAARLAKNGFRELRIFNTICDDTVKRQKATMDAAKKVDVMLVVGGRNSANTRRLFEICKRCGTKAYSIEVADQIKSSWVRGKKRLGIASGASTPDWIILDVVEKVKRIKSRKKGVEV